MSGEPGVCPLVNQSLMPMYHLTDTTIKWVAKYTWQLHNELKISLHERTVGLGSLIESLISSSPSQSTPPLRYA